MGVLYRADLEQVVTVDLLHFIYSKYTNRLVTSTERISTCTKTSTQSETTIIYFRKKMGKRSAFTLHIKTGLLLMFRLQIRLIQLFLHVHN